MVRRVFLSPAPRCFYVLGRTIVSLKISDPKKCFIFQWPKIDTSCIKLLVSTGGRAQNPYEISSFFFREPTTPGTQPFRVGRGSQPTLGVGKPGAAAFSRENSWFAWCFCRNFLFCNNSFVFLKIVFIFVLSLFQQGLWTQLKNIGLHYKTNISQICIIYRIL